MKTTMYEICFLSVLFGYSVCSVRQKAVCLVRSGEYLLSSEHFAVYICVVLAMVAFAFLLLPVCERITKPCGCVNK